jgi:uncharacterized protein (DUF2267 family)
MVVLTPRATVREAARAMMDNHVGSIPIAEQGQVHGIVTDRDLTLEVIGCDLEHTTLLSDVMSEQVATVDVGCEVEDVVRTMQEHACRRVPIVEEGRPVGLVSLDDLLIDRAIDIEAARAVVLAQLEAPARFKEEGALHPEEPARPEFAGRRGVRAILRHQGRAEMAYARLLRAVEAHTALPRDKAALALTIVLSMLCRRVTPEEARHLLAQLPSKLQPELERHLDGPDRHVTTEAIKQELARRLHVSDADAGVLISAVCEAVAEYVSPGEIEEFRGQLPLEMKDLFPPTPLRRTG